MPPPESSLEGRVVAGRYRVEQLLAEGGMGRVYRAVQIALDRPVALKCIHPHLVQAKEVVSRFLEEARLASRLSHPNIVQIYDFGQAPEGEGGELYLAMELLDGVSLDAEIQSVGALPSARAVDILRQVLAALGEAHAQGIVHRDVKPENVILSPTRGGGDRVKLIDFGIARANGAARLTQAGLLVGTPHFIAPELVRGEAAGPLADLYAAGAVLFQMLTGVLPFDEATVGETLMSHLAEARPDPRVVAPERAIPDALALVCIRSIALEPKDRFATADELSEVLAGALGPAAQPSPRSARPSSRPSSSRPSSPPAPGLPPRPGSSRPSSPPAPGLPPRPGSSRPSSPPAPGLPPRPPNPVSERYTVLHGGSPLDVVQRIEQRAQAALAGGDREGAARFLADGIARVRAIGDEEQQDVIGVALGSMGCLLAALLRDGGQLAESRSVATDALAFQSLTPRARALLLEQLARTLLALDSRDAAEVARIDALLLAVSAGDDALLARLEDLERSTSLVPPSARRQPHGPEAIDLALAPPRGGPEATPALTGPTRKPREPILR